MIDGQEMIPHLLLYNAYYYWYDSDSLVIVLLQGVCRYLRLLMVLPSLFPVLQVGCGCISIVYYNILVLVWLLQLLDGMLLLLLDIPLSHMVGMDVGF